MRYSLGAIHIIRCRSIYFEHLLESMRKLHTLPYGSIKVIYSFRTMIARKLWYRQIFSSIRVHNPATI